MRRTVGLVDGRIEIGPPTSASSRRLVALDTTTTAVPADHLEQRARPPWVFTGKGDGPLNPASFSNTFERLVARVGVPQIRLHDLRHTYATIALRAGVHPAVVSERLGHSSIAVTIDLYSHTIPGLQRDAAGVVGDLILGAAEPSVGVMVMSRNGVDPLLPAPPRRRLEPGGGASDRVLRPAPRRAAGGGKWEAMHEEMAGFYEVRIQGGGMNHRLFCVLERDAADLGG